MAADGEQTIDAVAADPSGVPLRGDLSGEGAANPDEVADRRAAGSERVASGGSGSERVARGGSGSDRVGDEGRWDWRRVVVVFWLTSMVKGLGVSQVFSYLAPYL